MSSKLGRILNEQRRTGHLCDVIIRLANGVQISGHFSVLAAQSDFVGSKYFLQKDLQFSIHYPLTIEVQQFECAECLGKTIDFMYSDVDDEVAIFEDDDHASHIQHLARLLSINSLMEKQRKADGSKEEAEFEPEADELLAEAPSNEADHIDKADNDLVMHVQEVTTQQLPEAIRPRTRTYQYKYGACI